MSEKATKDDDVLDFSGMKKWFKKESKTEPQGTDSSKKISSGDDDLGLDFSGVKKWFSKSSAKASETSGDGEAADVSVDWSKVRPFLLKYGWILLLLIPLFLSTYYRVQPAYLPIADDWAQNSVTNFYRNQIASSVNQQYPHLPVDQQNVLINEQLDEFLAVNEQQVELDASRLATQLRSELQDDDGQTYLLAIDPYLWYGQARNYVENGHWGTAIENGESIYTLRNGRLGIPVGFDMMPFLGVLLFYILNIFGSASVMTAMFYLPVVLLGAASLFAFGIGKKAGKFPGAITAGCIVAVHAALLGRTAAGFADTDNLITFFELGTIFLISVAFFRKDYWKWVLASLAGVSMAIYSISHASWWHTFDFAIGALVIYLVAIAAKFITESGGGVKKLLRLEQFVSTLKIGGLFVGATWIAGIVINLLFGHSFTRALNRMLIDPVTKPLEFITLKQVGITTIWPNVLTTVAELSTSSLNQAIAQLGGKVLFGISIIGALYFVYRGYKKSDASFFVGTLIVLWYVGAMYAAQSSLRFIAFVVPAFALGCAGFVTFLFDMVPVISKGLKIHRQVTTVAICIGLLVLFIPLFATANTTSQQEVPSMNDAWYSTLTKIHDDASDGIITSWWDFGHWFVAVGRRHVTFDGADQGERIHWVGRSLLESDEAVSVGILRMLNCAQEQAPHVLGEYMGGGIHDRVAAIDLLYSIFPLSAQDAEAAYEQEGLSEEEVSHMMSLTHCADTIPQYYITSQDMIGKASVWGHFGSWDFTKAAMFNLVKGKPRAQGIQILMDEFGLEEKDATTTYQDIQVKDGDRWISPWPGIMDGPRSCTKDGNAVGCAHRLNGQDIVILVDLDTNNASIAGSDAVPNTLVRQTEDDVITVEQNGSRTGFSITLIKTNNGYNSILASPELADSMFTRLFFLNGHGLRYFDEFEDVTSVTGQRIVTWKVDFNGGEPFIAPVLNPIVREGSTVAVNYVGSFTNGTVFDSSIRDATSDELEGDFTFADHVTEPLRFVVGTGAVIPGFDNAVVGMSVGEVKEVSIPPSQAYGTNPAAHPLGNRTLQFTIQIASIE